jgi:hypothetical protein
VGLVAETKTRNFMDKVSTAVDEKISKPILQNTAKAINKGVDVVEAHSKVKKEMMGGLPQDGKDLAKSAITKGIVDVSRATADSLNSIAESDGKNIGKDLAKGYTDKAKEYKEKIDNIRLKADVVALNVKDGISNTKARVQDRFQRISNEQAVTSGGIIKQDNESQIQANQNENKI